MESIQIPLSSIGYSTTDSLGILLGVGTNDETLIYPGVAALIDTMDLLGLEYEYYEHDGGHAMPLDFRKYAFIFLDSLMPPPKVIDNINKNPNPIEDIQFSIFPN